MGEFESQFSEWGELENLDLRFKQLFLDNLSRIVINNKYGNKPDPKRPPEVAQEVDDLISDLTDCDSLEEFTRLAKEHGIEVAKSDIALAKKNALERYTDDEAINES